MAGSQAHIRGIPVIFVRHGQSTNNTILEPLFMKEARGEITRDERERLWGENRVDDPELTGKGKTEARALGKYLKEALNFGESKSRNLHIYTSAFKRTLDTTKGIIESFDADEYKVQVRPDIFETGGVYIINDKNLRDGPGKCFSAADISSLYKGYDTSLLPVQGPWYVDGWENDTKSRERAYKVSNWIKSDEFRNMHNSHFVVFVMHGNFIDHLQKAILNIPGDPNLDSSTTNDHNVQAVSFGTPNSATSLFTIFGNGRVSCRHIGGVDHLALAPNESAFSRI